MKQFLICIFSVLLSSALFADTRSKVTIFSLPGCVRCAYMLDYLRCNKIRYTEYSTSDKTANDKMWEAVRNSGKYEKGTISMPVIIINNQSYFNIYNLEDFAQSINSLLNKNESASDGSNNSAGTLPQYIYLDGWHQCSKL